MNKKKVLSILLFVFLAAIPIKDGQYYGLPFRASLPAIIIYFGMFIGIISYLSFEYSKYLKEFGCYYTFRIGHRSYLTKHYLLQITTAIILFKGAELLCFLLVGKTINFSYFMISIIVLFSLLLLGAIFELIISPEVSLFILSGFFLVSLFYGEIIYDYSKVLPERLLSFATLFSCANCLYDSRFNWIIENKGNYTSIMLISIVIVIIELYILSKKIKKLNLL